MEYAAKEKILIYGMGSSGKTALLYLFYHLGIDIGFKDYIIARVQGDKAEERYRAARYSGLEYFRDQDTRKQIRNFRRKYQIDPSPVVLKTTVRGMTEQVWKAFSEEGFGWEIEHLILCVSPRDKLLKAWKNRDGVNFRRRKAQLPEHYYDMLVRLSTLPHQPRVTLVEFPRFTRDCEYCYEKLLPVLKWLNNSVVGISYEEFMEGWDKAIIPKRVEWDGG